MNATPWRIGLGLASAAVRSARAVTIVGVRAAAAGWRSPLAGPVRAPVGALLRAAEEQGARDEARLLAEGRRTSTELLERLVDRALETDALERVIAIAAERRVGIRATDALLAGDSAERLITHLAEQPALDALMARVLASEAVDERLAILLSDPALERLMARVLASRFAEAATEQVLASDELQRVVSHIARSDDVREAIQSQGVGLANEVADQIRDRTTTVDDTLERTIRRLLRRRARGVPVTEIVDAPATSP